LPVSGTSRFSKERGMSPAPKPLAPIAVAFVLLASGCVVLGRIGEAVFLLWSGAVVLLAVNALWDLWQ
jgi:hypothetical protein